MKTPDAIAGAVLDPVLAAPRHGRRRLVAIAGPPASGKSTISTILARLMTGAGYPAEVVPMDGFHLDNTVLSELGFLNRKGAPETFDSAGLLRLVPALANDRQVFYPTFDRDRDLAIGGAGSVGPECDTVLVEGNYLLFDAPVWRSLALSWDFSIRLDVKPAELERRLAHRWIDHGLSTEKASIRAQGNDMKNAALVARHSLPASLVIGPGGQCARSLK